MYKIPSPTVFHFDAGKVLKYFITNTLKKPNWVSIRQFFVQAEQLYSYLEMLPYLFYNQKVNPTIKEGLILDDADLATHLLRMCTARWQAQCNLSENTTPVSTRALLLMVENIDNNANLDYKPTNPNKPKGAEGKCKMESINSRIPKKHKKVGWTNKHCVLCKKHGGRSRAITCATAVTSTKTECQSRIVGAQVGPNLIRKDQRVQILCSLCVPI